MALLRKGCLCCELRTCVLVQAWWMVLASVLMIAAGSFLLALMAGLIPLEELPEFLLTKARVEHTSRKAAAAAAKSLQIEQALQGSILLLSGLSELPIAIALLYGCKKENRRLILPALIWVGLAIVSTFVMCVVQVITLEAKLAALVAACSVVCIGFAIYFWLHTLSYFMELREEEKELKRQTL